MSLTQIIVLVVIVILAALWFKMRKTSGGAGQADMAMPEDASAGLPESTSSSVSSGEGAAAPSEAPAEGQNMPVVSESSSGFPNEAEQNESRPQ